MLEDLRASGLTEIAPKAYLSRKDIEELVLPDTIEEIGNWAFAHMKKLRRLVVPCREIRLGKEVFKGCEALEQVCIESRQPGCGVERHREKEAADAAYLLAAALRYFGAQELFVPQLFATQDWFAQVDTEFLNFLSGCDENGFNPMWFGGEEDYNDNDTNVEIYRRLRQKEKLSVVMCRLLHDAQMTVECRERYHSFLRSLLLDGEAEVLWQFLAGQYAENSGLISVLTESGCVSAQNREAVLQRLSGIGAEGKALLLTWYTGQTGNGDFFGEIEL